MIINYNLKLLAFSILSKLGCLNKLEREMYDNKLSKDREKIRELRIKRKLSQETLAELCNLSSSYISYIETGKKRLSFATLEKLSKYLNFDIDIYDKNIKKYSNKQAFLKRLITLIEFEFENTHLDL